MRTTNRTVTPSRTSRILALAALGLVPPIVLGACRREEEVPPPVVAQPMPVGGLTADQQARVSRACTHIARCKSVGAAGAEYESCMRDLGRYESFTGTCGAQHSSLVDCISNLGTCDQSACATQSAATTACGALPPGLLTRFLTGQ